MLTIHALFPKALYETKMSVGRALYIDAMSRLDGVKLTLSGIGWPGYDAEKTVKQNLGEADALWIYKGEGLKGCDEFPVRAVCFNEANHPKTLAEIKDAAANLVVFHHESDMALWSLDGIKTAHILHGADRYIDRDDRPLDCAIAGVMSPAIYPLRSWLLRVCQEESLPYMQRQHPGYRLSDHTECCRQYGDYIKFLSQAKLSLTCCSVYGYPLAKIIESMAVGAVPVCDMPNDSLFQKHLGEYIIPVHLRMEAGEIADIIRDWLSRPDDLRDRSKACIEAAKMFSTSHYAARLANEIRALL